MWKNPTNVENIPYPSTAVISNYYKKGKTTTKKREKGGKNVSELQKNVRQIFKKTCLFLSA